MSYKTQIRLKWSKLYHQLKNAGKVCERYGISRHTLTKWLGRYEISGEKGLLDITSRPKTSPLQKRSQEDEKLIINMRKERNLGARRIQSELKRLHGISFSTATIHKVLKKHAVPPLKIKRHYRKQVKRYNAKVPGERIQMDVCKVANNLYQYTAIDDCTRYKVLALYNKRTATNTIDFLSKVRVNMPFPVQRVQTDRGQEFFAYVVQDYLKDQKIKFRPIKPLSPHLNGKVERTQRTDLDEFYSNTNIKEPTLAHQLNEWVEYYNRQRSHSSLKGKTPWEKYQELEHLVPSKDEVYKNYDSSRERFVIQNYHQDQLLKAIIRNKDNPSY